MLQELQSNYLQVCKVPSAQGGYVRCAISYNCQWYREFCESYKSTRRRFPKPRTFIKRRETIKALERMLKGDFRGVYADRLKYIMESL